MAESSVRLTQTVKGAGCAAKLAPGDLDRALCGLELPVDDNLIIGLERADDAGVYRISDDLALVQTLDFFPPMVDDPYDFGRIAAANALSDVYAMGGTPKTAMNVVAFPAKSMDISVLRAVIDGGLHTMREAGVVLVGGHTVTDPELKYGLAVTGFIHPDRILTKRSLRPGDQLILTKPLGTGIVCTAIKAGLAGSELTERLVRNMATLNREAALTMQDYAISACTDITGFGFLGHLAEMVVDSGQACASIGRRCRCTKKPWSGQPWGCFRPEPTTTGISGGRLYPLPGMSRKQGRTSFSIPRPRAGC
jgi:selenide, water dikinase